MGDIKNGLEGYGGLVIFSFEMGKLIRRLIQI